MSSSKLTLSRHLIQTLRRAHRLASQWRISRISHRNPFHRYIFFPCDSNHSKPGSEQMGAKGPLSAAFLLSSHVEPSVVSDSRARRGIAKPLRWVSPSSSPAPAPPYCTSTPFLISRPALSLSLSLASMPYSNGMVLLFRQRRKLCYRISCRRHFKS